MKVGYRLFTLADIDQLIELWNENAEWGIVDRKEWERRFYNTPFGPTSISLAINKETGEVLGQFIFVPSKVSINGEEVKAFRPFAPIVKKNIREELGMLTLFEYISKMYKYATKQFVLQGVYLIHMLPDPRWARAFHLLPGVKICNFPLWSLPLPKEKIKSELPEGYMMENINPSDSRIDNLWIKAAKVYGCCIVRNTKFLPWKLSHGNYQLLGIMFESRLIGLLAFINRANDKQVVICDVLAEDENALEMTLRLSSLKISDFKFSLPEEQKLRLDKIAILATPQLEKIISKIGFVKDNYKFPLIIQILNSSLSKKNLKPERWYVSAND